MFAPAVPQVNAELARDVAEGLSRKPQKTLPASWLYDDVGSALFEVITVLPEYGLTRADGALLRGSAGEIIAAAGKPELIFELGSGTGTKTRHILLAAAMHCSVRYLPIDISRAALDNCGLAMQAIGGVGVEPIEASYLEGIGQAVTRRGPDERVLILFLGQHHRQLHARGGADVPASRSPAYASGRFPAAGRRPGEASRRN